MSSLGRSLSKHQGTFLAGGWLWYIGGLLAAAGVFGMGSGLMAIITGASATAPDTGLPRIITAVVCLVLAPLVVVWPVILWRQTLEIFEGGFSWQRLLLGEKQVPASSIRNVTHVTHRSRNGTTIELVITLTDGQELSITGLDRADQAANLIGQLARGAVAPPPAATGGWQPPGGGA